MAKKVDVLQQKCIAEREDFLWMSSNESLTWVNISEEDSGNTVDNIRESVFSDVTQFYIGQHLNTFSKCCGYYYVLIIIMYFNYLLACL